MKLNLLVVAMALSLVFAGVSSAEKQEKAAPKAVMDKMMMEHVGMACTNCHGDNGPKGVNMGNHPGQKCTDCHEKATTEIKKEVKETIKTPLANSMMLEHEGMDCRTCHGEKGPKDMAKKVKAMMSHKTLDCKKCHTVTVETTK